MKFKVKQQQDKTIVQALIFKNEELVERELNTISLNAAKNFLRPTLKKDRLFIIIPLILSDHAVFLCLSICGMSFLNRTSIIYYRKLCLL